MEIVVLILVAVVMVVTTVVFVRSSFCYFSILWFARRIHQAIKL